MSNFVYVLTGENEPSFSETVLGVCYEFTDAIDAAKELLGDDASLFAVDWSALSRERGGVWRGFVYEKPHTGDAEPPVFACFNIYGQEIKSSFLGAPVIHVETDD